jgi:gliding motility-associated-like protein
MAQTTYELCDTYIQKEIRANTSAPNTDWSVNPLVPYQVNSDVMTITIKDVGTYMITATFTNGLCYTKDQLVLTIIECKESFLWIPNSFTPDGDEHNNIWKPVFTSGLDPYDFRIEVYNRWGELIWVSENPSVGWDGTYNGKYCQDGIYLWKLEFGIPENDGRKRMFGHLTTFR